MEKQEEEKKLKEEEFQKILLLPFGTNIKLKEVKKDFIETKVKQGRTIKEAEKEWREWFEENYKKAVERKLKEAKKIQPIKQKRKTKKILSKIFQRRK